MVRHIAWLMLVAVACGASPVPTTRPAPLAIGVRTAGGDVVPATGPVAVPYALSNTDHLIVRLKINGHGPYNFILDTGAPTLLVDEGVADQIGLRPVPTTQSATRPTAQPRSQGAAALARGWATVDRLDVEGGLTMAGVKCLVLTPYQITSMNALGVAGADLQGLMGYSVLARFKIDVDLTRHVMRWTPQPAGYVPPPIATPTTGDDPDADAAETREGRLEALGGVMRFLGPLVKASLPGPGRPRGWVGLELGDGGVVTRVADGGPAAKAGVRAGDRLETVDGTAVHQVDQAERATAEVLPGQAVRLAVRRGAETLHLTVTCEEGL